MSMTTHQEKMLEELHVAIVGNEKLGHTGIIKRQVVSEQKLAELELQIDLFKPVVDSYIEKKTETKKLRNTIIGSCVTLVITLAGHLITLIILNNK